MPGSVHPPNGAQELLLRQDSKETQTDDGVCEEAGPSEVSVHAGDHFVEPGNSLMNLSADATNEKVAKRRQFTEK
jgi:hypothetical protein